MQKKQGMRRKKKVKQSTKIKIRIMNQKERENQNVESKLKFIKKLLKLHACTKFMKPIVFLLVIDKYGLHRIFV